jgi:hypothetical protein
MTLHDYTPGPPVPDLPVLPIGALVVGTENLLQQAADLPQPRAITIYDEQLLSLQFDPCPPSLRAITRWALRFGGVLISEPHRCHEGTFTFCHTEFGYYGVAVTAWSLIPAPEDPGPGDEDQIPHADYPHLPGRLHDCPACQARCHCTPGDAQCVYDGLHNGLAAP